MADPLSDAPSRHDRAPLWWMSLGAGFVVLGGVISAATGPLDLSMGSWLAAYLVLVCGVPQYVMGRVIHRRAPVRSGWLLLACWNLGNAGVVTGSLLRAPYVVDVGGALLLVVLITVLVALLRHGTPPSAAHISGAYRWGLVAMLLILIVSTPIGLTLAHLRAG